MEIKKKILLVDDIEMELQIMQDALGEQYECVCASNGEEGLQILKSQDIDLVLTDISMPVMDGYLLLTNIRLNPAWKELTVLVITAIDEPKSAKRVIDLGANDIILKPFDEEVVNNRIRNLLDNSNCFFCHNVMEDIVKEEIEKNLDTLEICTCDMCKRDLLTLTLNRLQPKYVSSQKGAIISKVDQLSSQVQMEIAINMAKAAEIIRKHPHH